MIHSIDTSKEKQKVVVFKKGELEYQNKSLKRAFVPIWTLEILNQIPKIKIHGIQEKIVNLK